jgi:hypothetical protein
MLRIRWLASVFLVSAIALIAIYQAQRSRAGNENYKRTSNFKGEDHRQSGLSDDSSRETGISKPPHDWVDYANALSTMVIAVFTLLMCLAVRGQTRTSQSIERAWVMVDAAMAGEVGVMHGTSGDGSENTGAVLDITCRNVGPTPAWVFEQYVTIELKNIVIASQSRYVSPRWLESPAGTTSQMNYRILPLYKDGEAYTWRAWIQCPGWATPRNELHSYIYGIVRYRDAFKSLRETYFGYWVNPNTNELQRIPNESYNKHT